MWGNRVKSIYVQNGFMQLGMAEVMGDVLPSENHVNADFNRLEPLAILTLVCGENLRKSLHMSEVVVIFTVDLTDTAGPSTAGRSGVCSVMICSLEGQI